METESSLIEWLRGGELFAGLDDKVLGQVAALCLEEVYSAKTVIFSEGEPAHRLYVLQAGIVVIRIQPAPDAESIVVHAVDKKCEAFGWSALVEPAVYTASAVCATDVQVIAIDGQQLTALLDEYPASGVMLMRRLAAIISSRLRRTQEHLTKDVHLASYRF